MFSKEVKTQNGVVKTVVAGSEKELREAVSALKLEVTPTPPNINDPADANVVVSPNGQDQTPVVEEVKKKAAPKKK